jgi:predicted dehydrogenase
MAETTRVGIIGCGWPGTAHARGYKEAGGFKIVAVADLIPQRRKRLMQEFSVEREFAKAEELINDKEIDAVSIGVPTALHAPLALAALRAGKHVVCEKPPAMDAKEARKIQAAADKAKKVLLYGFQRRFGGAEQASRQAIEKGYAGECFHARVSWMRTRGIPLGVGGWFATKSQSGGGALIDLGLPMLDLAWHLLGEPKPLTAFAVDQRRFGSELPPETKIDVEDSAFAIVKCDSGKSIELSTSWAINQPPSQQGTVCRVYGKQGAVDVYTPDGAVLWRSFDGKGAAKSAALKPPRTMGHVAMMRHFRECITGKSTPLVGGAQASILMSVVDAMYKSIETGKSVDVK